MAQNHTLNTGSCDSTASNTVTVPQTQDAQVLPAQALEGKYMLSHGVRLSVVITSACLSACGLALIVLGAIGSSSKFLQGLSGLNAVVTGLSLLLAGSFGCVAFFQSKASVGRMLLIGVVATCHISGAFAIQCIIISGQLVVRYQAESCDVMTPSGAGMHSEVVPYNCLRDTSLVIAACILPLAILGFFLGIACSASCYFAAPRLLCCLFDVNKRYNQPTGVESIEFLAAEQYQLMLESRHSQSWPLG